MTQQEIEMVVIATLRRLGLADGEISERKARQTYGKPFKEAVASGLLKPVRVGSGKTATKHYRIIDILALQNETYKPATIKH